MELTFEERNFITNMLVIARRYLKKDKLWTDKDNDLNTLIRNKMYQESLDTIAEG